MKCLFSLLLLPVSLLAPSLLADPIEVGAKVPAVTALNELGETIDLAETLKEGFGFVYFYPKSFTGGCTAQACSLRDEWTELQDLGVKAFGVSSDDVATQAAFRQRHLLPFSLLADVHGVVSKGFGAPTFSRQAYLFKDGVLVWRDLRASTRNQARDVLNAIAALSDEE